MSRSVLECTGIDFRMPKVDIKFPKFSIFLTCLMIFFGCSAVGGVFQESLFHRNTRELEQDTCNAKEKALRVLRAVNIG